MPLSPRAITRRRFVVGAGSAAAALALQPHLAAGAGIASPAPLDAAIAAPATADGSKHLAWVWQFSIDGPRSAIRRTLAEHGLGIVLKTHDGIAWMSQYDRTPDAVSGPQKIAELARFFEDGGVPFHAWCVVHGTAPMREAEMAADVLDAGARSIMVDLEPHAGFWRGSWGDAVAFGTELRRRAPNGWVVTSIDPRPWLIDRIPLQEFASFSNELAPQTYWESFRSIGNLQRFIASGFTPPGGRVTPRFVVDNAAHLLRKYGLPIHPIGEGSNDRGEWSEFLEGAYANRAQSVSVWRFGVADPAVWEVLRDTPPPPATYTVQPGDTLASIARRFDTSASALAEVNALPNIDRISVGQVLTLPAGQPSAPAARVEALPAPAPSGDAPVEHIVQSGESLGVLARRWNTSVSAISQANGISNPNLIRVGQVLRIPGGTSAPVSTAAPPPPAAGARGSHVVQAGDTLSSLARRWNTSASTIAARNGITNMNLIRVGQRLEIP